MKTLIALAMLAGCGLQDDGKNACFSQQDCVEGTCVDGRCTTGTGPDGPGSKYYGTVEPLASASTGISAENYETMLATTTAAGNLGCAVVGDLKGSPGGPNAVVYAKVQSDTGDKRCPTGTFAIVNDVNLCGTSTFPDDLRVGCAIYKRWDASGTQVAYQLATGGYVTTRETPMANTMSRCNAEMSIRFGNVTIAKTFVFDYNPLGPASAFCVH